MNSSCRHNDDTGIVAVLSSKNRGKKRGSYQGLTGTKRPLSIFRSFILARGHVLLAWNELVQRESTYNTRQMTLGHLLLVAYELAPYYPY